MKINLSAIWIELDKFANPMIYEEGKKVERDYRYRVDVKLKPDLETRIAFEEYERKGHFGYNIKLNPNKIHTDNQLEKCLDQIRKEMTR